MPDLSGHIASFGVRQTLELLGGAGKSGELRFQTGRGRARVLFHEGKIAYATSASGSDTVEELDRLLMRYQPDDSGIVPDGNPDTLEQALEEQVTEVLYEVTDWTDGSFEYHEKPTDASVAVHVCTVDQALQRVDIRLAEWKAIRTQIPANDTVFSLAPLLPAGQTRATFDGLTWRLLALIGDGGSVDFIAGALEVSPFRAARMLADLIEAGFVERDDEDDGYRETAGSHAQPVEPEPASWDELTSPFEEPAESEPLAMATLEEEAAEQEGEATDEPAAAEGHSVLQVPPPPGPVTFSKQDLTEDEKNELIRNIGKGIFPA